MMKAIRNLSIALALISATCFGDDAFVLFDTPIQPGIPGQTLSFSGQIINLDTTPLFLNSLSVNLPGPFTYDTTGFFNGPLTVDSLASTGSYLLLTVTVDDPYTGPFGDQAGTVTVFGGPNSSDQLSLGGGNFTIQVPAPEPSTLALGLCGGLLVCLKHARVASFLRSICRRQLNSSAQAARSNL
jgi:hypothetical protein